MNGTWGLERKGWEEYGERRKQELKRIKVIFIISIVLMDLQVYMYVNLSKYTLCICDIYFIP